MVSSKRQILELIQKNKQMFRGFGADKIGLFGSFVRGDQTENSDVDLLVEFLPGQKNYRNFLGTVELAERLVGRDVELLTPGAISPYIAPYIQEEIEYVQTA